MGSVLKFCADGLTFEVDCAKFGFECGYDKDFEEDTCLMPECKGVPEEGACDGNTLKVCLGGQVLEMNCSLYDSRCGWDEDFEEYDCL